MCQDEDQVHLTMNADMKRFHKLVQQFQEELDVQIATMSPMGTRMTLAEVFCSDEITIDTSSQSAGR